MDLYTLAFSSSLEAIGLLPTTQSFPNFSELSE